jgi:hypothetical protein
MLARRAEPKTKHVIHNKTAIFRQVDSDSLHAHRDALEFPDGEIVLLTYLMEGQGATVLQLPATILRLRNKRLRLVAPPMRKRVDLFPAAARRAAPRQRRPKSR